MDPPSGRFFDLFGVLLHKTKKHGTFGGLGSWVVLYLLSFCMFLHLEPGFARAKGLPAGTYKRHPPLRPLGLCHSKQKHLALARTVF